MHSYLSIHALFLLNPMILNEDGEGMLFFSYPVIFLAFDPLRSCPFIFLGFDQFSVITFLCIILAKGKDPPANLFTVCVSGDGSSGPIIRKPGDAVDFSPLPDAGHGAHTS